MIKTLWKPYSVCQIILYVQSCVKSFLPSCNNEGNIFSFPALDRCHFAVALGKTKWGRNKNCRFSTALVEPSARGYSRTDDWTGLVPVTETGSCLYTNRHFFNATSRPQQGVTRQSYHLHWKKSSPKSSRKSNFLMMLKKVDLPGIETYFRLCDFPSSGQTKQIFG